MTRRSYRSPSSSLWWNQPGSRGRAAGTSVYTKFFGLNEKPFSITPDPRYLFMSRRHADALAHLVYGVSESGGFIQLTGEVGTGKTTLIRSLLEQLPEKAQIALILNPQLSAPEFLQAICQELAVDAPGDRSVKSWIDILNAYLLEAHAAGRRVVLIVDEAQQLGTDLLEQVRLLTNLETAKAKLLQIILIGQPELRDILARPDMRQIAQRITGRYHLEPLSRDETVAYVNHRMKVAGATTATFSAGAMRALYAHSHGIPRLINVVADRALLAAYAGEQPTIGRKLVRRAAAEVFGRQQHRRVWRWAGLAAAGLAFAWAALVYAPPPADDLLSAAPVTANPAPAVTAAAGAAAPTTATASPLALAASQPLFARLEQAGFSFSTDDALSGLFAAWEVEYDPGLGAPCEQALAQALRCLVQTGSIGLLRRMNRPAVLTLTDERGVDRHVLLRRLDERDAELISGPHSVKVELGELASHWFGEHLLLWQPHTTAGRELAPGMRDQGVHWLRETLGRIDGHAGIAVSDPLLYDAELVARVRTYQQQRRLQVDGIVGVQTQLALSADAADADLPVLAEAR